MKYLSRYIRLFLLFTISLNAYNQHNNNLFILHQIPQSGHLNPANQIDCRYFISIPGLTDLSLSYNNSAFTYNDLAGRETLDLDRVYNQLLNTNMVSFESDIYAISLGYRNKRNYFSFHIAEKTGIYASFPKKLARLGLYGNKGFLGQDVKFRNLRVNASWYREYSIGYSSLIDYFTIGGIRAKLLFGKANVHTGKSIILLDEDPTNFALNTEGEIKLNSSYPLILSQNSDGIIDNLIFEHPDYSSLLMNYRNPGIAIDAGIIKRYSSELTLSASILDLGFISWNDNINRTHASAEFEYSGIDAGDDFSSEAFLEEMLDSVINSSTIEISHKAYFTPLPLKIYLGANYQWQENLSLGFVSRNILINRRLHSSATLSLNSSFRKYFLTSLNWTIANNSLKQVGGGIALTGRGFQFHIFTDNALGFIQPFDSRTLNLQMGMNLLLGCPHSEREARLYNSLYGRIPGGNCSWTDQSKKKAKFLKKVSRKRKY